MFSSRKLEHGPPDLHSLTTVYKSQGQTIEYVLIDIRKPPTGTLSPFSIYVALSWSRGRDTIMLLRSFDPNLFQNHPSEELRHDMRRLERLNEETKNEWETRMNEACTADIQLSSRHRGCPVKASSCYRQVSNADLTFKCPPWREQWTNRNK